MEINRNETTARGKLIVKGINVFGLFGTRNFKIDFVKDYRILIGENGLGKTTFLKIINFLLTGDLIKLADFDFKSVMIRFWDEERFEVDFKFEKESILNYIKGVRYVDEDLTTGAVNTMTKIIFKNGTLKKTNSKEYIEELFNRSSTEIQKIESYGVDPTTLMFDFCREFNEILEYQEVLFHQNLKILYLPTYRRIEADLSKLMNKGNSENESIRSDFYYRHLLSISMNDMAIKEQAFDDSEIKFGMKDVLNMIKNILDKIVQSSIRGYSEISGQMISHLISGNTVVDKSKNFQRDEIEIILQRIGNSMIENDKKKILNLVENGDIYNEEHLCYFLYSLLDNYNKLKTYDEAIKRFASCCNDFLVDKEFRYDESHVKLGLYKKGDKSQGSEISLSKLSSGEKQLVAMMALVHLEMKNDIVFLIDEPEISLSIIWQEKLLPHIVSAPKVKKLLAVTHSPFIYNNELKQFAFGTPEYSSFV